MGGSVLVASLSRLAVEFLWMTQAYLPVAKLPYWAAVTQPSWAMPGPVLALVPC